MSNVQIFPLYAFKQCEWFYDKEHWHDGNERVERPGQDISASLIRNWEKSARRRRKADRSLPAASLKRMLFDGRSNRTNRSPERRWLSIGRDT